MKYQVTASPAKGQKTTKQIEGMHDLKEYLEECRELGYDIKKVRRMKSGPIRFSKLKLLEV